MRTVGWSPKVYLPAMAQLAVGGVLVVAGSLAGDGTLLAMGYTALGAGLATLGVGYAARPGTVVPERLAEPAGTGPDEVA